MKRLALSKLINPFVFLYGSILILAVFTTWVLKAQQRPPEKKYSVSLPLNNWVQITQQLEFIKGQLRQSDLPSKQVAYLSDSLLTPMQSLIGVQVNQQLDAERPKPEVNKDSIAKPKKN